MWNHVLETGLGLHIKISAVIENTGTPISYGTLSRKDNGY